MPRPIRLPIVLCALALSPGLAAGGASAAPRPSAHSSAACKSVSLNSLRGGYFLGLTVKGVGCATGRSVEVGWQNCRLKSGFGGRCRAKVLAFGCREQRQSIPTQITAKVSCRRGSRTVDYTYQQNLV